MLTIFPAVHTRLTSTDLVLEEVDSGDDQDKDQEKRSEQSSFTKQAELEERLDQEAMSPSAPTSFLTQEDAETQTGRWTPFIESIKKEAEDKAMATIEERLVSRLGLWKLIDISGTILLNTTIRHLHKHFMTTTPSVMRCYDMLSLRLKLGMFCLSVSLLTSFINNMRI